MDQASKAVILVFEGIQEAPPHVRQEVGELWIASDLAPQWEKIHAVSHQRPAVQRRLSGGGNANDYDGLAGQTG